MSNSYLGAKDLQRLLALKSSGAKASFIAATLGCSPRTVRYHVRKSRESLESEMSRKRSYDSVRTRTDQAHQAASVLARRVSMHVGPWYLDRDGCMTRVIMSKETRRELEYGALGSSVEMAGRPRLRSVVDEGQRRAVADGSHPDGDSVLDWEVARGGRSRGTEAGVPAEPEGALLGASSAESADGLDGAEPAKESTGGEQAP